MSQMLEMLGPQRDHAATVALRPKTGEAVNSGVQTSSGRTPLPASWRGSGARAQTLVALAILGLVLALRMTNTTAANAGFVVLAAYAVCGRAQAVLALGILWCVTMMNGGLADWAAGGSAGRYGVIAAAALSVAARGGFIGRDMRIRGAVLSTLFLGAYFLFHSALISVLPTVSALKSISWVIVTGTLLGAWGRLPPSERRLLESQVFNGAAVLLLVSLPLVGQDVGYVVNGTGFQGVLNHPQAFGAVMAILASWLVGALLSDPSPSWSRVVLPVLATLAIVLSESRTGVIALGAGTVLGIVLVRLRSASRIGALLPGLRGVRVGIGFAVAIIAAVFGAPFIGERLSGFVTKRAETTSLTEVYDVSRGFKVREMWVNIEKDPMQGIGFGVASDPSTMVLEQDPLFGIPTGAPVEKGVLLFAVIEEVGIPGALLIAVWLWMLVRKAASGGVKSATVMCTALLTNMGEATLFSPGGLGLLVLLVVAWAGTEGMQATPAGAAHA